jgi:hypothetical protein
MASEKEMEAVRPDWAKCLPFGALFSEKYRPNDLAAI